MIDVSPRLNRVSDCPSLLSPAFNADSNYWPAAERERQLLIFPAAAGRHLRVAVVSSGAVWTEIRRKLEGGSGGKRKQLVRSDGAVFV